jgi:lipopolysaccharide biosynthesis protein
MRSVCFFASYFTGDKLPYYITVYLKELKHHFTEVVLLTSNGPLSGESKNYITAQNIQHLSLDNKGFDFGLWYHAFQRFDVSSYDKIALVNDSCILFRSLNDFMHWSVNNKADLQGITFSESIATHIQSYFLILNKKSIALTTDYFNKNGILNNIDDVIKVYEIGLSTFLSDNGLKLAAYIDNGGYKGEFSPYYHCLNYHLNKGIPVIKKKIMFASYRKEELFTLARMDFNIDPDHYSSLIQKNNTNLLIDFHRLKSDIPSKFSAFSKLKYDLTRKLIKVFRPLYKKIKGVN